MSSKYLGYEHYGQGDYRTPKPCVRQAFARYLQCGIFAHGFARARCGDCGHDYFVAFSCKGRGVCLLCSMRRMVETAAHLTVHAQRTGIREERLQSGRADTYAAGADQPHCRLGATAAHPPASLLQRASTKLAAQGGGYGHGAGSTFATGQGASRASHCAMRCANPERTCAFQTLSSPLSVGRADRPYLLGVPTAVPAVRRPDANSIAFITHSADIRQMLDHIGVQAEPPNIAPARGPPMWEDFDAQMGEGAQVVPDWDLAAQPAPDYELDQRINW